MAKMGHGLDAISADAYLDSRDIEERIDYLEGHDGYTCGGCGGVHALDFDGDCRDRDPEEERESWTLLDAEEREELDALRTMRDECGSGEWRHGLQLIREDCFEDHARELAEDCGMLKGADSWPGNCIDWERAARELQTDYSCVDFDGHTYYYRD